MQRGLAVILDVVYNHLGPDGNYLGGYSRDYFNPKHKTPWGDGFNFELQPVRDFFVENTALLAAGISYRRLSARCDPRDRRRLGETSPGRNRGTCPFVRRALSSRKTSGTKRNCCRRGTRGGMGLDAIWADDFHHVVRVMLTGMREGYFKSYRGTVDELAATLDHGWLLEGEERERQDLGQPGEADGVVARASLSSASAITIRSGITLSAPG